MMISMALFAEYVKFGALIFPGLATFDVAFVVYV